MEAYRISKLWGTWGAETDIHLTKDDHVILMHDNTVDRTTDGTGAVADLTLEEIKALNIDVNVGEFTHDVKVPTLDEFLITCKELGQIPVIEIKTSEPRVSLLIDKTLELLQKHSMLDKSILISFSKDILKEIRQKDRNVWVSLIRQNALNHISDDLAFAEELGNFAMFCYNPNPTDITTLITKEQVDTYHQNGIPVIHGTTDIYDDGEYVKSIGVDAIVTNQLYDSNRPLIRHTLDVRSQDSGISWELYRGNYDVTFDTSAGYLDIAINDILLLGLSD